MNAHLLPYQATCICKKIRYLKTHIYYRIKFNVFVCLLLIKCVFRSRLIFRGWLISKFVSQVGPLGWGLLFSSFCFHTYIQVINLLVLYYDSNKLESCYLKTITGLFIFDFFIDDIIFYFVYLLCAVLWHTSWPTDVLADRKLAGLFLENVLSTPATISKNIVMTTE